MEEKRRKKRMTLAIVDALGEINFLNRLQEKQ